MKKTVLAAAILLGGLAASQAGIDFHIGIDLFPHPERVVISHPCPPPAPVVVAAPAPVYAPAPVVVRAPVCAPPPAPCETRVVYQAPVVYEQPVYYTRGYYRPVAPHHREYVCDVPQRGWDRPGTVWDHDRGHVGYRR